MNMEPLRILLQECWSVKETINKIWTFDKSEQLKVVLLLWRWWSARNKMDQGGKTLNVNEIQSSVIYYLSEFEELHITNHAPKAACIPWKPPPDDIQNQC